MYSLNGSQVTSFVLQNIIRELRVSVVLIYCIYSIQCRVNAISKHHRLRQKYQ